MNPYSIKKIINKKVTFIALNDYLPVKTGHSPKLAYYLYKWTLLLFQIKTLSHGTQHQ